MKKKKKLSLKTATSMDLPTACEADHSEDAEGLSL